jgi:hypothetical protein
MKHPVSAILFTSFVSAAISPALAAQSDAPQVFIEGLSCTNGKYGMRLPATLPKLLALAPVTKEEPQETERWDGYTTTRKRIHFEGLSMDIVTFSNNPNRYMVAAAELRSPAWARLTPFAVGESITAVRAKLGKPAEADEPLRATYAGENESLRFQTRAGRVTAVVYECYTG